MPAYVQPATNRIVVSGQAIIVPMKVGANATAAKMVPGAWVILDTTENEVKEAGAKAHGVIGLIDTDPTHDIDDAYAVGDLIPIIIGPNGLLVMCILLANEDVIQGDVLVTAANGVTAEKAVGAMGAQGDVVAEAWDTSAVASDVKILARLKLCPELAAAS